MNIVVAVLALTLSFVYLYFAVRISKDCSIDDWSERNIEFTSDYNKTRTIQWVISAIFSVIIILLSLSLMYQLNFRFYDFYAEYGCFLWAVFFIQAFSMLI